MGGGSAIRTVKTSIGLITSRNGQFLVEQKGDRTMLAGVVGDVSTSVGEGGVSVTSEAGDVIVLQTNEDGKVVAQLVDLKTGTVVSINEDGIRGEVGRADPALQALAANTMARAIALTLIGATTETFTAVTALIQQINLIVPGFADQFIGQAVMSASPEQVLNPDFNAPSLLADTTKRPDMTKPLPERNAEEQAFFEETYREMSGLQRLWSVWNGVEGRWLNDSHVRWATAGEGNRSGTAYTISPYGRFLYGSDEPLLQWVVDYRMTATFFDEFGEENSIHQLATKRRFMKRASTKH